MTQLLCMPEATPHIAIVDDDSSVRKALARLIGARAFNAQTFGSAREFIESLELVVPDCLVVDLQMPEMTGLDLQIHLARVGLNIPTIIITAHDEPALRQRCGHAGALAYLSKPLDESTLIAAITSAMSRDRAKRL